MWKLLVLLAATAAIMTPLSAREFHVDKTQKNLVKFTSDAKFETFDGVTDKINGYVSWAGNDVTSDVDYSKSEIYFEVELNGLDTGIGLRNRHMRENYLETDKYPYAHYRGKIIKVDKGTGNDFNVITSGMFFIHGIERPVTIDGTAVKEGEFYHLKSQFQVQLPDYGIKVPTLLFLKISETIQLKLDFYIKEVQKPE